MEHVRRADRINLKKGSQSVVVSESPASLKNLLLIKLPRAALDNSFQRMNSRW